MSDPLHPGDVAVGGLLRWIGVIVYVESDDNVTAVIADVRDKRLSLGHSSVSFFIRHRHEVQL